MVKLRCGPEERGRRSIDNGNPEESAVASNMGRGRDVLVPNLEGVSIQSAICGVIEPFPGPVWALNPLPQGLLRRKFI
jgi:hypothetical protein